MPYNCESDTFVVSPVNARKVLGNFLQDARKQLLIYDPKISDKRMIRILKDRIKAGVELRVIGQTKFDVDLRRLSKMRLHTRTIIRDGEQAFIGSQSLRGNELDARREVGVIVHEAPIVKKLVETFESDWASGTAEEAPDAKVKEPEIARAGHGKSSGGSGQGIETDYRHGEEGRDQGGGSGRRRSTRRRNRKGSGKKSRQKSSEAGRQRRHQSLGPLARSYCPALPSTGRPRASLDVPPAAGT